MSEKIKFSVSDATRDEATSAAKEQAKLDKMRDDLARAESSLAGLKQRAVDADELIPLGGATERELASMQDRIKAVEATIDKMRKVLGKQERAVEKAQNALQKARDNAQVKLQEQAVAVAQAHMDRLFAALSEAVKANMAVRELQDELREKKIKGVQPYPAEVTQLLPTALQPDGGYAMASVVSQYKGYLKKQYGLEAHIYDGNEIERFAMIRRAGVNGIRAIGAVAKEAVTA